MMIVDNPSDAPFDLDAWNAKLDAALDRLAEIERDEAELHRHFIADLHQLHHDITE